MASKMISLRVDEDLIREFDEFAENVGSDRSNLITMFLKSCVKSRALPFHVKESYNYPISEEG